MHEYGNRDEYYYIDTFLTFFQSTLWAIWLLSLFVNQIILLNFLIADISAAYADKMTQKAFIWYSNKLKIMTEVESLISIFNRSQKDNIQKEKVIILQFYY